MRRPTRRPLVVVLLATLALTATACGPEVPQGMLESLGQAFGAVGVILLALLALAAGIPVT